jgi:hypothetical protein
MTDRAGGGYPATARIRLLLASAITRLPAAVTATARGSLSQRGS